jgi:hypothetical protein
MSFPTENRFGIIFKTFSYFFLLFGTKQTNIPKLKQKTMASIRRIKKDLRYLVDEVIGTALVTRYTQPKKHDEIDAIIEDIDDFYEDMILKINNPEVGEGESKKKYFRKLYDELLEKVNGAFENLHETTKNVESA